MSVDPKGNAVILLEDREIDALKAVTFKTQWSEPVVLVDQPPDVKAFDADALGNCTLAWAGEDNLFTVRNYDASTKTWSSALSFGEGIQNDPERLFVKRDLEGYAIVLGQCDISTVNAGYGCIYSPMDEKWHGPGFLDLGEDERIVDCITMGNARFMGFSATETSINSVFFDINSNRWNLNRIKTSNTELHGHLLLNKDRQGNPVIAWTESPESFRVTHQNSLSQKRDHF